MIIDAVAKAATIEEAQQAAITALSAPEDVDVRFEVLTFPEKKKFGLFGGKLAEVRAYYEIEDAPAKKEPKKAKTEDRKPKEASGKPKQNKKPANKANGPKPAAKKNSENNGAKAPAKADVPKKEEQVIVPPEEERTPVALEDCPDNIKRAYDYLTEIIRQIGVNDVKVNVLKTEKEYFFEILSEEDYSLIIGRRGETLDSIQYLVRLAANRGREEGKAVRISLNVGDYRQKRERTLRDIARKNARRVRKFGRNVTLNPMNPSERRIIHTTVSEIEGVCSYSIGSNGDRRVVIALEEGVKPLNDRPQQRRNNNRNGNRGGNRNGNRNGGNRGGNRGGNGGQRRPASQAPAAPAREARSDAEGIRYGKITPKFPAADKAPVETVSAETPAEAPVEE